MKNLTSAQRDELIEQFVELQVDSMDIKDLVHFVTETLKDDYGKLTDSELKDEIIYTNEQELYDELVDNITSEKCTTYEELIESNS
jgi:hypothetical protein